MCCGGWTTRGETDARLMAHAAFGLLNSTPHSVKPGGGPRRSRAVLRAMTVAALTSVGWYGVWRRGVGSGGAGAATQRHF